MVQLNLNFTTQVHMHVATTYTQLNTYVSEITHNKAWPACAQKIDGINVYGKCTHVYTGDVNLLP